MSQMVKGGKAQTEQMFSGLHLKAAQGVYERRTDRTPQWSA
jgi:hypothetical protein